MEPAILHRHVFTNQTQELDRALFLVFNCHHRNLSHSPADAFNADFTLSTKTTEKSPILSYKKLQTKLIF